MRVLVKNRKGEWMGYCSLTPPYKGQCSLMSLSTKREHRNKGVASTVVKACKKFVKKNGYSLRLFVGPFDDEPMDKDQLLTFYMKQGFVPTDNSNRYRELIYNPKGAV